MRTGRSASEKTLRELAVTYCVVTAMKHCSDAQLLCIHYRSASSYVMAIIGMEEMGKAFLLQDGSDLKNADGYDEKLRKFFDVVPWFQNIDPAAWAKYFVPEANSARFVDTIDVGGGAVT